MVQQFQIERRSEEEYNTKDNNKSNTVEEHTYTITFKPNNTNLDRTF